MLTADEMNIIGDDLLLTPAAVYTSKGDLFVGTGSHAGTRLGTNVLNGQALVSDSAEATGLKWQSAFTAILIRTSNKSISHNTVTAIDFTATNGSGGGTSELYDAFNLHDNSVNNTRIEFNRKGIYIIGGYAVFAADTGGTRRYAALTINGTQRTLAGQSATPSNIAVNLCPVTLAVIAASSYVELEVYQDSGGNVNCTEAHLWAVWLHDIGL